jgi:uncharacterized protein (DUF2236 family)
MTRTQDIAPLGPDSLTWRFFGDTRMALVGVRAPVWRAVHPPLHVLARFLTVGGLPPRARELLGLGWSAADERRHRRFAAVVRRVWPLLPRRLRYVKAARRAFARDGAPRRPPAAPP